MAPDEPGAETAQTLDRPTRWGGPSVYPDETAEWMEHLRTYTAPDPVLANFGVSGSAPGWMRGQREGCVANRFPPIAMGMGEDKEMAKAHLARAQNAKNDEFRTQWADIQYGGERLFDEISGVPPSIESECPSAVPVRKSALAVWVCNGAEICHIHAT